MDHAQPQQGVPVWAILTAIGVGAFLAVMLICGGLGFAFFRLVEHEIQQQGTAFASVQNVNYDMHLPDTAVANQSFYIDLVVTNTDSVSQSLYSLDFYSDLLDSATIVNSQPAWQSQSATPQYQELVYRIDIPPGQTQNVRLELRPTKPGTYNVNIDACINDELSFIERYDTIAITPAANPQE